MSFWSSHLKSSKFFNLCEIFKKQNQANFFPKVKWVFHGDQNYLQNNRSTAWQGIRDGDADIGIILETRIIGLRV